MTAHLSIFLVTEKKKKGYYLWLLKVIKGYYYAMEFSRYEILTAF